jgi:hypothetical protein|tara:strand:- start:77 stop:223 length:147 start_codon:yes stop_codon:yes gene_type:complete
MKLDLFRGLTTLKPSWEGAILAALIDEALFKRDLPNDEFDECFFFGMF